jgi:TRAP-type uncharacterized transport system fused permease subunit
MAAYAAATIAGADMMKTGITASFFSLAGYILPFMFVLNPAFLMEGTMPQIVVAALAGAVGVMVLGVVVAGQLRTRLRAWERAALLVTALLLIFPTWPAQAAALVMLAAVLLHQYAPAGPLTSAPVS